jgi:RNA polymerase sigma-70 factor, ECF subfamily
VPAAPASVHRVEGGDGLLAARLAAGDDRALAEAFDRLGPAVYGAALRVLGEGSAAQDVVQDVFVDLWRHPGHYDPAAGALRAYLIARARHRAVHLVRSDLRRIARQERHHRLSPGQAHPSACEEATAAEAASVLRAAVRQLPDAQRRVIELACFDGPRAAACPRDGQEPGSAGALGLGLGLGATSSTSNPSPFSR